jgi:hypothetical protein
MRALWAAAAPALLLAPLAAQVSVTGRVVDENGTAVPGARIEFRRPAALPQASANSDVQGRFHLALSQPGEYSIRAEKEGFFVLDKVRVDLQEGPNEVNVNLNHLQELTESLDVVYSPPAIDPAETSDQRRLNSLQILEVPYPAAQDYRSALPMFSGVVQDAGGSLHFNGGASDQASYSLDGFNIADPVTGALDARVSVEAVRNLDLESSRYSASRGRGSAGSLNLETGMGDDRYRFGATNFVPSVSTERGLTLTKWTPRLTASGPIARSKAWFYNAFDAFYDVNIIPELPRGQDRNRSLTSSNLSRVQVNLTPSNILTGSYLINYIDTDHQNLSFLDPVETTLHDRRSLNMATVKDQIYFAGGALVQAGFAASRGVLRSSPQGPATFVISPAGRSGNYFVDRARRTDRQQWIADFFAPPLQARGQHRLQLGADLERSGFDQRTARHDYLILREDGAPARHVSFTGTSSVRMRDFESAFYLQDSWTPREGLLVNLGMRGFWNQVVRSTLASPRLSAAWSPWRANHLKIAAGFGIFDDALNLQMLSMNQDQSSVSTFYSRDGTQSGPPVTAGFLVDRQSLRMPRARLYSLSLERTLPQGFYGRVSYLRRTGWNGITFVEPGGGVSQTQVDYTLRNQRSARYDALELSARRSFGGRYEWFGSYTYSRARSNAVMDYSLENPVFGKQDGGPLGWDTPHRLLTWGWAPVPSGAGPGFVRYWLRELSVNYLIEARSGFPFSVVNEENFVVDRPNRRRLPCYFNVNLHMEKRFRFLHWLWALRFGLNNLTNHGNPNVVNNNIDSPSFLAYGRGQRRAFTVRLRFLGRR